ncbi:interleukin-1 receptor-associated kinase 1-binding protein 1 isoform X2 [Anabrus simplex]|uniref:interleukin-1 receptor-associated kinase 1-binding protein 1 isoform X2 n=1 Tax=Anabrus simplex TaxID=316456 RepID=UPI0034DD89F2
MDNITSKVLELQCNDSREKCSPDISTFGGGDGCNVHITKVEGYGEVILEPDVIEFVFKVESTKEKAEDAKSSVSKRIDYLVQTIKNFKIRGERPISVHHSLSRVDGQFRMVGEVLVKCDSVHKYEDIVNIIVEKLEGSVLISEPHYSHSPKCTQEGRQRALRMAMINARTKAADMASSSYQRAGRALLIEEKESRISKLQTLPSSFSDAISLQGRLQALVAHSRVGVVYELVSGGKPTKNNNT